MYREPASRRLAIARASVRFHAVTAADHLVTLDGRRSIPRACSRTCVRERDLLEATR